MSNSKFLFLVLVLIFTNGLTIYIGNTIEQHLDNVADAFCYSGRMVYDGID